MVRSFYGKGWTKGDLGHGPAYAFTTCDGHPMPETIRANFASWLALIPVQARTYLDSP